MRTTKLALAVLTSLVAAAAPAAAQMIFEVEVGAAYTIADIEAIAGADGAVAQDWSQAGYHAAARAVAPGSGSRLGVEAGYHHLFTYDVRIPFGSQPIQRTYSDTAVTLMGFSRFGGTGALVDLGAGVAIAGDLAAMAGIGLGWHITERVQMRLRVDVMVFDEPYIPVGLAASYALGGS